MDYLESVLEDGHDGVYAQQQIVDLVIADAGEEEGAAQFLVVPRGG